MKASLEQGRIKAVRRSNSSRESRETSSSSHVNISDTELTSMIRDVNLEDSCHRRTTPPFYRDFAGSPVDAGSLKPYTHLSDADFEAQARSNSLAASLAVASRAPAFSSAMTLHSEGPPLGPLQVHPCAKTRPCAYEPEHRSDARKSERLGPDFLTPAFHRSEFSARTSRDSFTRARGWQQPRFTPGHLYEELMARDRLKPPTLGGRSKKDQLGSVNESWGELGQEGPKIYGMFEIERDPPSRSTSPFKEHVDVPPARDEVREAKREALTRAREGTAYDRARTGGPDRRDSSNRGMASSTSVSPTTPAHLSLSNETTVKDKQGFPDSAYASHIARRDCTPSTVSATPASTMSRDVFGPRRRVSGWGE